MHIILGALGSIVTILVLLHRLADLGIDLGGLNPFLWRRRRAWRSKYHANPVYSLEDPLAIAGVLLLSAAKIDGDLSVEERHALLDEFESTFALGPKEASDLLASSAYLLGDGGDFREQLAEALARYKGHLSAEQVESLLGIMERVTAVDARASEQKRAFVDTVRAALAPPDAPRGTWGTA